MGVGLASSSVERWPLTGRSAEFAAARNAIRHSQGIVVLGDAGVGKTRLVREVVESLGPQAGWHTVTGSSGATAVPLGAWSHLLPDTWQPAGDDLATWRFLASHLGAVDGGLRLLVDDAQWLDPVSVGLLHHLVTTRQATAVVTARRDDANHTMLTTLWKDGDLLRVDLEPFTLRDTGAVLEAALGDPVEPHTVRRLHDASGGNALMLRELVDAARADGKLRRTHGAWVQSAPIRPSARLVDLLADRLDGLTPAERTGAEVLALGEPLTEEQFAHVAGGHLLPSLAARRFVQVEQDGNRRIVRSVHPVAAQVLVDRMATPQRTAAIEKLIDAFEATGATRRATDVLRVALWRLEIGAPIDGATALHAAELAITRTDFVLAEKLARRAVVDGDTALGTVVLGEALVGQLRHLEAEATLAPLHGELATLTDDVVVRYARIRALSLYTELGRVDDAVAVLRSTLATLPDGPPRRMLEARIADLLADCGRLRAAAPLAEACIRGLEQDESAALGGFVAAGLVRTLSGRCRDTLELCERMLPVAMNHQEDVPAGLGWIVAQRMLALYTAGDLADAAAFVASLEPVVVDDPDSTLRALVLMWRATVEADRGRLDEALRDLRLSAALHDLGDRRGYQSICFAITARVHAERGEAEAAGRALDAAYRHLWPGGQVLSFDVDVAAIWVAMARGDRTDARQVLKAGVEHAEREGMTSVEAYLRHQAIRAGLDPADHTDALTRLAVGDQSRRTAIWAHHATALAEGNGTALELAAAEFADLGQHLHAAEAYAQAAICHRRDGSPALATRAGTRRATELAECSGAATPALRHDPAVAGLTARELDIAARAAAGTANRDIAADLGISVRTVETHLQRAFDKLGLHRRGELAALFATD